MASSNSGPAVSPANGADPSAPTRIKRNTACVRCRDAKVRCNASLNPDQPCLRCSKLDLGCVVDKGHKRTSRRSKLEELAAELNSLKQTVGASSTASPPVVPPPSASRLRGPPFTIQTFNSTAGIPTTYSPAATSKPSFGRESVMLNQRGESPCLSNSVSGSRPAGQGAEPRALASSVFSGEDIDYYFDKYFEHFHPYMPVVCIRDPDACYKAGPVLFWAILVTSCRRYAKRESISQFLVDAISPEISSAIASTPVRPPVITALIILSAWSLPTIRFMNDPTYVYTGIALNSALWLGLHTGKGNYLESSTKYDTSTTDEEATYIWTATNIVSQRTSSYLGYPPTALFTGQALHGVMDGTSAYSIPRSFGINLAAARFSNRLLKALTAGLDDGPGISYHLVEHMEQDFITLQRSLHDGTPDVDDFMLRSALLEIQVLYWTHLPGRNDEALRRNLMRTHSTSEGLIELGLDLERKSGFLSHAPHYVFRWLLLAACSIVSYLRWQSPSPRLVAVKRADELVQDAMKALKTCSVQADDLPIRSANMMQGYWKMRHRLPPLDIGQLHTARFKHRLGASIVFDCLGRFKSELENTRVAAGDALQAGGTTESYSGDATLGAGQSADLGLTDPLFQAIDWSSFMDDFEWNIPPSLADLESGSMR